MEPLLYVIFYATVAIKTENIINNVSYTRETYVRSRVQKFPAGHTKAAPNGKCCEGYIVQSMVRLMYQLKSVLK